MTYIDIHTHHYAPADNVLSIENIHENFGHVPGDHAVSTGLHPWWLDDADEKLTLFRKAALHQNVFAIGECGLDKLSKTKWSKQVRFFEAQAALAEEVNKPLIIHCVRAFSEVSGILKHCRIPVIFHGVNKRFSVVKSLIDSGYYLSFGKAMIDASDTVQETFRKTPLSRIFLETDDSGISIKEIFKTAAEIRNVSENEIALQIQKNFHAVFKHAKH